MIILTRPQMSILKVKLSSEHLTKLENSIIVTGKQIMSDDEMLSQDVIEKIAVALNVTRDKLFYHQGHTREIQG